MFFRLYLAGVLAAGLGLAQRNPSGSTPDQDAAIAAREMRLATTRFDRLAGSFNLDKDQKKAVRAALDDAQKEAAPLRDRIIKTRALIGEAVAAHKSEDEIKQAGADYAALVTQMTQLEMKSFAKIVASLDEKQKADRQSLGPVLMMMNGLFMGKNWNEE
ncbi:MAG: hypothetical protein LAP87_30505 [Acidobacteriia bacterium]|nr:hypothetical protein [Terriglobia bacterium]